MTIGFSPQDIDKATSPGIKGYDFVLIDGLHTNAQILKDFKGILPHLSDKCVVYLHDVGYFNLYKGFEKVVKQARRNDFNIFCPILKSTMLGSGVVARKVSSLKNWIKDRRISVWNYFLAKFKYKINTFMKKVNKRVSVFKINC